LRRKKLDDQLRLTTQAYWDAEQTAQAATDILARMLAERIRQHLQPSPHLLLPPPVAQTAGAADHRKAKASAIEIQASTVAVHAASATLNTPTALAQATPSATSKADKGGHANDPQIYLKGWKTICQKLKLGREVGPTLEAKTKWLKRINRKYHGPIYSVGPGKPPITEERSLLDWWNSLPQEFRQFRQKKSRRPKSRPLKPHNEMTL